MHTEKYLYPKGVSFEFLQTELNHITRSKDRIVWHPRGTFGPFWSSPPLRDTILTSDT